MPESKPAPAGDSAPAKGRLSHRAPPKPERRNSSIPAALVTSTTASRIPPAPKPPRRIPTTNPPPASTSAARVERESERPVAAEVADTRRQGASSSRRWAIPVLLLAGAAGLGGWMLQQRSTTTEALGDEKADSQQGVGTHEAEVERQAPKGETQPTAFRTIDLDEVDESDGAPSANGTLDPEARARPVATNSQLEETAVTPPSTAETSEAQQPVAGTEPSAEDAVEAQATARNQADSADEPSGSSPQQALDAPKLPPFDTEAARSVLNATASNASSCRRGDDPRGTAEVLITFSPSGRVTSANVNGEPFGGTATGGCIASTMRQATVPPFTGDHVTVRKLVKIH